MMYTSIIFQICNLKLKQLTYYLLNILTIIKNKWQKFNQISAIFYLNQNKIILLPQISLQNYKIAISILLPMYLILEVHKFQLSVILKLSNSKILKLLLIMLFFMMFKFLI